MYSFFNGIADNVFFLGVACECIKVELTQMGFSQIDFYPVDIDAREEATPRYGKIHRLSTFHPRSSVTRQYALWVMERQQHGPKE